MIIINKPTCHCENSDPRIDHFSTLPPACLDQDKLDRNTQCSK